MKRIISTLSIVAIATFVMACNEGTTEEVTNNEESTEVTSDATADQEPQEEVINKVVSPDEFKEKMTLEGAQLIDVRTPGEVAGGMIEGATNIDFNGANFKEEMAKLDRDKPVLVYCRSGGRSGQTASMLKSMGFKEVYDLQGGYMGWPNK